MNTPSFSLSRPAIIAAFISAAFPMVTQASVGRVEFAIGAVNVLSRDGSSRTLAKGGEINNGDTIRTTEGRVQIRFSDGGYISLQPNTEFKVEDYSYTGKPDGNEKGFFSLVKGGLRAITGAIGHTNKQAYRVNTPVATIGIRGTEYLAQYNNTKLLVKVGDGAVYLVNSAGDIVLYKGQIGEVGEGVKPQYSEEQLTVSAAGPSGGTPQEVQQEQQNQQQQEQIFLAGELRTEGGVPSAVVCCQEDLLTEFEKLNQLLQGPLANLNQLAALDAGAVYTATNAVTMSGCTPSYGSATSILLVNFMSYEASFLMNAQFSSGVLNGKTVHGGVDGSLNPSNGTFAFSSGVTQVVDASSSPVGGTGSLSVNSAALNSANLSQATVNYSFSEGYNYSSSGNISAQMNGIAFPNSAITYPEEEEVAY